MIPVNEAQQERLDSDPNLQQQYSVAQLAAFVQNGVNKAVAYTNDVPESERGLSGDALAAAVAARKELVIQSLQVAQFHIILIQRGIDAMFSEATKQA